MVKIFGSNDAVVLGCGPAGLFAAHALTENGYRVTIHSKLRRSEMYGAQYLHHPIPGLTDDQEPVTVRYQLEGTAEDYRAKVYGNGANVPTSVETLEEEHEAWDIRAAYYKAWSLYANLILHRDVTPLSLQDTIRHAGRRTVIVSSIPLRSLCFRPEDHVFSSQQIWAIGDAPERGVFVPFLAPHNTVVCNGLRDTGWYRMSNVFGYRTVEWPGGKKPPIKNVAPVEKPIATNCDCFHPRVYRVGRYGTWTKGVLAHEAYVAAGAL